MLFFGFLLDQCNVVISYDVTKIKTTFNVACFKLLKTHLNFTHFTKQVRDRVIGL